MSLESVVEKAWKGFGDPFSRGVMSGIIMGLFPVYAGMIIHDNNQRIKKEEERLRRGGWSEDEIQAYFNREVEEYMQKHGIRRLLPSLALLTGGFIGGLAGVSAWYNAVSVAQRQGDPTEVVILTLANAGLSALFYAFRNEIP